jgi:hypothetical protein
MRAKQDTVGKFIPTKQERKIYGNRRVGMSTTGSHLLNNVIITKPCHRTKHIEIIDFVLE